MYENSPRNCLFYACYAFCIFAIASIDTSFRARAQTPSTDPSFEVATVKPVDPSYRFDGKHFWVHVTPAGASYWSMTPAGLIAYAYGVESFQVVGPDWAGAERFDIEGKFPDGADRKDQRRMLQALLKDRFSLSFHIEKRELDGEALVVGKHGAKLTPSLPDPVSSETSAPSISGDNKAGEAPAKSNATRNADGSSSVSMGKRGTLTLKFDREHWATHFEYSKMTMEELAVRLSSCSGGGVKKMVDETGLQGDYQVAFDCPLATAQQPPAGGDVAGTLPSDPRDGGVLPRSLDALGLKLERRKFLQDVYVIDHIQRPSEN